MLAFDTVRVLRNGKKYETGMNTNMSEHSSLGNNPAMSIHEDDVNGESETRTLALEVFNEQMRNYIAS